MIKSLEGVRGIAALIVALYHLGIGTAHFSMLRNGYLFVDIFFVLSGFVMCAAYAATLNTSEHLRAFLIRRIGRLLPLLVFSTLFFVLVDNAIVLAKRIAMESGYANVLHSPNALDFRIPAVTEVLATVTFTHGMGVFDRLILNTPSWSISVEFFTYLLFAALCLLAADRTRIVVFALCSLFGGVVTVWASVEVHDCLVQKGCLSLTYDFGFPRAVLSFFLGALVYIASRRMRHRFDALQFVSAAALALVFAVVDALPFASFFLPPIFALLILSICSDNGPLARMLAPRPLQVLGQRSYSIYLMHMPLVLLFENFARRIEGNAASIALLVAYVVTLVIVSGWTYRFIEDPLRHWFNTLAFRPRATASSPVIAEIGDAPPIGSDRSEQA